MAYLDALDKDKEDLNTASQQQQGQIDLSGGGGIAGSGGGQGSQAGPGASQVNWSNIQDYLKANQGNTTSSDTLNTKVGGEFDKEQQGLTQNTTDATTKAQGQVDKNHIGQDTASQLVQQAGQNYSYNPGQQNQQYQDATGKLKGSLSANWQDVGWNPYAMGAQAQQYGAGVQGNQDQFTGLLHNLYRDVGGNMGSGQIALQDQLDANDQKLADTRQSLGTRYGQLQGAVNQGNQDTASKLAASQKQFGDDKTALTGYLNTSRGTSKNMVDRAVQMAEDQRGQFIAGNSLQNYDYLPEWQAMYPNLRGESTSLYLDPAQGLTRALNEYVGPTANRQNIGGVDQDRNQFNAIGDVLGDPERIAKDAQEYKLGDLHRTLQQRTPQNVWDELPQIHKDLSGQDYLNTMAALYGGGAGSGGRRF